MKKLLRAWYCSKNARRQTPTENTTYESRGKTSSEQPQVMSEEATPEIVRGKIRPAIDCSR